MNSLKKVVGLCFISLFLLFCGEQTAQTSDSNKANNNGKIKIAKKSTKLSHEIFNKLLQQHVSADGKVNYKGFIQDSVEFNKYLDLLSNNFPDQETWSEQEQIAYWINAYNAFTIKLIIKHYPVKSIKDIKRGIVFVNTVWDMKFFKLGGQEFDLNKIEHGILRKDFEEPRIHFAVNCASESCPNLRNEAFMADKLEQQLEEQANDFINKSGKNIIQDAYTAHLSKIFSWFTGDFTKNGSLIDFINKYATTKLNADAAIDYLDYSWKLNDQ